MTTHDLDDPPIAPPPRPSGSRLVDSLVAALSVDPPDDVTAQEMASRVAFAWSFMTRREQWRIAVAVAHLTATRRGRRPAHDGQHWDPNDG